VTQPYSVIDIANSTNELCVNCTSLVGTGEVKAVKPEEYIIYNSHESMLLAVI
jgi:hypothetical protein